MLFLLLLGIDTLIVDTLIAFGLYCPGPGLKFSSDDYLKIRFSVGITADAVDALKYSSLLAVS